MQCRPLPGEEPSLEGRLELIKGRPEQSASRIFHLSVEPSSVWLILPASQFPPPWRVVTLYISTELLCMVFGGLSLTRTFASDLLVTTRQWKPIDVLWSCGQLFRILFSVHTVVTLGLPLIWGYRFEQATLFALETCLQKALKRWLMKLWKETVVEGEGWLTWWEKPAPMWQIHTQ